MSLMVGEMEGMKVLLLGYLVSNLEDVIMYEGTPLEIMGCHGCFGYKNLILQSNLRTIECITFVLLWHIEGITHCIQSHLILIANPIFAALYHFFSWQEYPILQHLHSCYHP